MRMVMRPRYYCEHCGKGSGSASAMKWHERGCTLNPSRVCGMCKMHYEDGGEEPAPPRDELVRIMDTQGFAAMCKAANNCPACILAALRTKNGKGEFGQPIVEGPEDGREVWSYAAAKKEFWDNWNSAQNEGRPY